MEQLIIVTLRRCHDTVDLSNRLRRPPRTPRNRLGHSVLAAPQPRRSHWRFVSRSFCRWELGDGGILEGGFDVDQTRFMFFYFGAGGVVEACVGSQMVPWLSLLRERSEGWLRGRGHTQHDTEAVPISAAGACPRGQAIGVPTFRHPLLPTQSLGGLVDRGDDRGPRGIWMGIAVWIVRNDEGRGICGVMGIALSRMPSNIRAARRSVALTSCSTCEARGLARALQFAHSHPVIAWYATRVFSVHTRCAGKRIRMSMPL